jgi:hypothetical protein
MQGENVLDQKTEQQVNSTISNSILGVDPVAFAIFLIIIGITCAIGLFWT